MNQDVERTQDETVGWDAFWALSIAALVLASLFAGLVGGVGVLAAILVVVGANRSTHAQ